jgi:hypothetical protein
MIDNIKDHHVPLIESERLDPDELLTDTLATY